MSGGSGGNVCHRLVCRCHSLSKAQPGVVVVGGPALPTLKAGGAGGTYISLYMCVSAGCVCMRMCVRSAARVCAYAHWYVCVCVCVCV